jgi:hypothetical protein
MVRIVTRWGCWERLQFSGPVVYKQGNKMVVATSVWQSFDVKSVLDVQSCLGPKLWNLANQHSCQKTNIFSTLYIVAEKVCSQFPLAL